MKKASPQPVAWAAFAAVAVAFLSVTQAALAHPGHLIQDHSAWAAGFLHPFTGVDHLLAMLASGLLAVRVGTRRAWWVVPGSFLTLMLAGGVLAAGGVPLPGVEWTIALSVIVLGIAVAALPRAPLGLSAVLVGVFAISHGHAHVAELSGGSLPAYAAGFALATLILHGAAITAGWTAHRTDAAGQAIGSRLVRLAGGAIAVGFALLLVVG